MKKVYLLIACLTIISIVSFAQSEQQQKTPSPKPNPNINSKGEPLQTAPQNQASDKAATPVDLQNPAVDKAVTKEKEAKEPHTDKSGKHPNGANAHGMEMKEKNMAKQKEKKEEHAEKKEKKEEQKAEKKAKKKK
jgi:hypothetical protein